MPGAGPGSNAFRRTSITVAARIIRQLFTESLLLAFLGSAAGVLLGYFVLRALMAISRTPAWLNPAPDWRVIFFSVSIRFAAALLFGLAPSIEVVRHRQQTNQHRTNLLRQILLGGHVAASCVLIIVSALLVRALHHALSVSPGFDYQQVVAIDPGLAAHGYSPLAVIALVGPLERGGMMRVAFAPVRPERDFAAIDHDLVDRALAGALVLSWSLVLLLLFGLRVHARACTLAPGEGGEARGKG